MSSRVYEISTLQDIVEKVPPERVRVCMGDIGSALAHMALMRSRGVECSLRLPIVWTDDDEDDVRVRYESHFREQP